MNEATYQYSAGLIRSPYRYALALWRVIRNPANTYGDVVSAHEIRLVEVGFVRSRFGRRFARWDQVANAMRADARMAKRLREQRCFGPIDVEALAGFPADTLGHVLAKHCRERGVNPNITYVQPKSEEDWILNHLYETHDIWHVATGWGNDVVGEIGIGGFYIAQLRAPRFLAFLLSLFFLKAAVFAPSTFAERLEAVAIGYAMGKRAEPLFGVNWADLWSVPLREVRERFNIDATQIMGEGIRLTA